MGVAVVISLMTVFAVSFAGTALGGGPEIGLAQAAWVAGFNPVGSLLLATAAWSAKMGRLNGRLLDFGIGIGAVSVLMAIWFSNQIASGQMPGTPDVPILISGACVIGVIWGIFEKVSAIRA